MTRRCLQGSLLRVGDTIDTWFGPQSIMSFEAYDESAFGVGTRIAKMASGKDITIGPDESCTLIFRPGETVTEKQP